MRARIELGVRRLGAACAARCVRALLLAPLAALVLAALSAPSALALRGHAFSATIGEPCTKEPCEGANLKEPVYAAPNEATGDVYVLDKGAAGQHGRVAIFSAAGAFLSEFNGSGELLNGKGEHFEAHAAGSLKGTGEIETGRFEEPEGIAVDNSCALRKLSEAECKEKDPSNGDVYVLDSGSKHRVVDKYSAGGEYLGQITEAGGTKYVGGHLIAGVAVDREGHLFVYREVFAIDEFSGEALNKFIKTVSVAHFPGPGFAVDGEGNFYLLRGFIGPESRITKVSAEGKVLIEELDKKDSSGVAADERINSSYVDNFTSVRVSKPEGTELETLGEEGGEHNLIKGQGLGVNAGAAKSEGSETLYVADAGAGEVAVFGPKLSTAPQIEGESIADVSADSATFEAEIDPQSEAGEPETEYQFQYGRCTSPATCASSPYEASVPATPGRLASDFEAHAVSAQATGLSPSSTYHFHVIAKNSLGEAAPGAERVFSTQNAGGQLQLADDRAWELVSPPDKQGALIAPISEAGDVQAAASGAAITYLANAPTEVQPEGYSNEVQILSARSPGAWSTRDIAIAHSSATGFAFGPGPEYKFFNPELTQSAVQPFGEFIPALSAEASESTAYLHTLSEGCGAACFHPLVTGKAPFANVGAGVQFGEAGRCEPHTKEEVAIVFCGPEFVSASEDLSHVVLHANAELKEGAGKGQLYEWSGGQLAQVSVLPSEAGAAELPGAALGSGNQRTQGTITPDGSQVIWEAAPNLYLRNMTLKKTIELDEAEACSECTSGGGQFQLASADGSRVLFTDTHKLTGNSGASPAEGKQKSDLYECRITVQAGVPHCALSDLTPKRGEESAEVRGAILGASEDGQDVYFVAQGIQSTGPNERGEVATAGEANLYLRHGGVTSFITRLSAGDSHDWGDSLLRQPTRVTSSGQYLELMSERSLTGYDNRAVNSSSGQAAAEVYLYNAATNHLVCASCDPSGARPVGVEYQKLEPGSGGLVGGPRGVWESAALVAANVPGWTSVGTAGESKEHHQPRYLTNSGRLFFNTVNPLVPQDANATQDVYEYEPPGVGSCSETEQNYSPTSGGCVNLISSGSSTQESAFMDASESGGDVFFLTAARLSPLDGDSAMDVYDAHVCSDSPCIQAVSTQSPPCETESSCRAPATPTPPLFSAPATSTFSGPGNPPPSPLPGSKPKTPEEVRIQKLTKALKSCRAKHQQKQRKACEKSARKRYAKPAAKKAKKSRHTGSRK